MTAQPMPPQTKRPRPFAKLLAGFGFLLALAAIAAWMVNWTLGDSPRTFPFASSLFSKNLAAPNLVGQIVDSQGQPIAGARVNEIPSDGPGPGEQTVRSDATGHFFLGKQHSGGTRLIVSARGYAPQFQVLQIGEHADPIQFTLSPGRTLHGHVKDQSGAPLPGTGINLIQWRGNTGLLSISAGVNAQGDFSLRDAPADNFMISAAKPGYAPVTLAITPGQDNVDLTLSSSPHVQGKVIDAKTHRPIPEFTLVPGVQRAANQAAVFSPNLARNYSNGQYDDVLNGFSGNIDAWVIRIEAKGYRPALSPVLHGSAQQDFQLQPARDLQGRILGADDKPVADAIVTVALPGQTLFIREGRTFGPNQPTAITAADGRFDLPAQIGRFVVLALSGDGFAQVHQDALAKSTDIRLSPWGHIAGELILDGKPAAGQRIAYRQTDFVANGAAPAHVLHNAWDMTDSQGRFSFDRIPPGPVEVYQVIEDPLPSGAGASWQAGLSQTVAVEPGKTVDVTLQSN